MRPSEPHFLHVCLFVRLGAIVPIAMKVVCLEFNPAFVERERVPEGADGRVGRRERKTLRDEPDRAYRVPVRFEARRA